MPIKQGWSFDELVFREPLERRLVRAVCVGLVPETNDRDSTLANHRPSSLWTRARPPTLSRCETPRLDCKNSFHALLIARITDSLPLSDLEGDSAAEKRKAARPGSLPRWQQP